MLRRDARRLRLVVPETRRAHRCLELGEPTRQRVGVKGSHGPQASWAPSSASWSATGLSSVTAMAAIVAAPLGATPGRSLELGRRDHGTWRVRADELESGGREQPLRAGPGLVVRRVARPRVRLDALDAVDGQRVQRAVEQRGGDPSTAPPRRHEGARHRPRRRIRLESELGRQLGEPVAAADLDPADGLPLCEGEKPVVLSPAPQLPSQREVVGDGAVTPAVPGRDPPPRRSGDQPAPLTSSCSARNPSSSSGRSRSTFMRSAAVLRGPHPPCLSSIVSLSEMTTSQQTDSPMRARPRAPGGADGPLESRYP